MSQNFLVPQKLHNTAMKTVVNITIIEDELGHTKVRMDAVGPSEDALALGLQVLGQLAALEHEEPDWFAVEMPTLSQGFQ